MSLHYGFAITFNKLVSVVLAWILVAITSLVLFLPFASHAQSSSPFTAERWGLTAQDLSTSTGGKILEKARFSSRSGEIQSAVASGDPYASLLLGFAHDTGIGTEKDTKQAFQRYQFACDQNLARGCSNLGRMHITGAGTPKNELLGAALYQRACDAGAAISCFNLGSLLQSGLGIAKDEPRAIHLLEQSCLKGFVQACNPAGVMFQSGTGTEKNEPKAALLYQRGCESGDGAACTNLGILVYNVTGTEKNLAQAAAQFQAGCAAGNALGCAYSGQAFESGNGVTRDVSRAAVLYQQACDGGEGSGCTSLGVLVTNGNGIAKDLARAYILFQKGCETNDFRGCRNAGLALSAGNGVSKDESGAVANFAKACNANDGESCRLLALQQFSGSGTAKNLQNARASLDRACDLGNAWGCELLAVTWSSSDDGATIDWQKAVPLYERACTGRRGDACERLADRFARGEGIQLNFSRAYVLYEEACTLGVATACTTAGVAFFNGKNVSRDTERGSRLLKAACDKGDQGGCRALAHVTTIQSQTNANQLFDQALAAERNNQHNEASTLYNRSCEAGNGAACTKLGFNYENGRGVARDLMKANALYQRACDSGNGLGCANLGLNYESANGVGKDLTKASQLYERACDKGLTAACAQLAKLLEDGQGVAPDPGRAQQLYLSACDRNYGWACWRAAVNKVVGSGGPKNESGAVTLFEKSIRIGGISETQQEIAKGEIQKWRAVELFNQALVAGRNDEHTEASTLYQQSCDAGNGAACTNLGFSYENGRGVARDLPKANALYERACASGNGVGCVNLGASFENGRGVVRDLGQATVYYQKGCDVGNQDGCQRSLQVKGVMERALADTRRRDLMERAGRLAESRRQREAVPLYRQVCYEGDLWGCALQGVMQTSPQAGINNFAEGNPALQKACDGSIYIACGYLGQSYSFGRGVGRDKAKSRQLYRRGCEGRDAFSCFREGMELLDITPRTLALERQAIALFRRALEYGLKDDGEDIHEGLARSLISKWERQGCLAC